MSATDTERYICANCGYVYDPAVGDPMNTVLPGTPFTDLPKAWVCPMCYASTDQFDLLD
jgi:rubredoxin